MDSSYDLAAPAAGDLSIPGTRWPCVSIRLNEVVWLSCHILYAGTGYSLENERAGVSLLMCMHFIAVYCTNTVSLHVQAS